MERIGNLGRRLREPVQSRRGRRSERRAHDETCTRRSAVPQVLSTPCRQADFSTEWYLHWRDAIADAAPELTEDQRAVWGRVWDGMRGKTLHRKLWEWCAIAQALEERDMLRKGRRGIGFAVGTEPLPSMFAARGARVLASDYTAPDDENGWGATGQLGNSLAGIHWPGAIDAESFSKRVRFRDIDMRDLSRLPSERFDFSWSSCSFEHLGSLDAGLLFLEQSLDCLKPGGVAVHTTEFNLSSNDETMETEHDVIYRRRDIEAFEGRLRRRGCGLEGVDFDAGTEPHDLAYDFPPYYEHGREHIKVELGGFISTSMVLVIRKGPSSEPLAALRQASTMTPGG